MANVHDISICHLLLGMMSDCGIAMTVKAEISVFRKRHRGRRTNPRNGLTQKAQARPTPTHGVRSALRVPTRAAHSWRRKNIPLRGNINLHSAFSRKIPDAPMFLVELPRPLSDRKACGSKKFRLRVSTTISGFKIKRRQWNLNHRHLSIYSNKCASDEKSPQIISPSLNIHL